MSYIVNVSFNFTLKVSSEKTPEMMEERYVMNKLPMFKGANYNYWKDKIIVFFESTHIDMWDVVEKAITFL